MFSDPSAVPFRCMTVATLRDLLPMLRASAARASRVPDEAEDLLQDALLEAVRAGRTDLSQSVNLRWLQGTIHHLGAMRARGAVRRRVREAAWTRDRDDATPAQAPTAWWADDAALRATLDALPPALRQVADLALAGHDRREIAWLLRIGDATLRQRIASLRRRLAPVGSDDLLAASMAPPEPLLALPLGLIRRALLPVVVARDGTGAHDPDGHLLVLAGRRGPAQP